MHINIQLKSVDYMSEKHINGPDDTSGEEALPKLPNYKLRRAVAGVALLATAGGALFGGAKLIDKTFYEPGRERSAAEATLLEEVRTGEREGPIEDALVVVRSGVRLRETPDLTSARIGRDGNVETEFSSGTSLIIDRPLIHTDERGHKWYGFRTDVALDDANEDEDTPAVSAEDIGDSMSWINVTALGNQENEDEKPYVELLYPGDNELMASIDSRGNITVGEADAANTVAVARELDTDAAEFFIRSQGR